MTPYKGWMQQQRGARQRRYRCGRLAAVAAAAAAAVPLRRACRLSRPSQVEGA